MYHQVKNKETYPHAPQGRKELRGRLEKHLPQELWELTSVSAHSSFPFKFCPVSRDISIEEPIALQYPNMSLKAGVEKEDSKSKESACYRRSCLG